MLARQISVVDDRQNRVPVLTITSARGDLELVEMIMRFAESAAITHKLRWWTYLVWVFAFVASIAGVIALQRVFPSIPAWSGGLVWPLVIPIYMVVVASRRQERHAQRLVEGLLHIGRCPSCGYRLGGLPHDFDGATVCPECAAAWSSTRIGNTPLPNATLRQADKRSEDAPPTGTYGFRWIKRTPTVLDARERPLPMVNLWGLNVDTQLDQTTRATVLAEIARSTFAKRLIMSGGVFLFGLFFVAIIVMNLRFVGFRPVPVGAAVLLSFPAIVNWMMSWRIWCGRSQCTALVARDIIVRHDLCASCGSPLMNESADPDLLTCPKCRAEWKLSMR